MARKCSAVLIILTLLVSWEAFSQKNTENRRKNLAKEFLEAFQEDSMANEDIVGKYMASCCYFSVDTVRSFADESMNYFRDFVASKMDDSDVVVIKYSTHVKNFLTHGHDNNSPLSPATLQPLRFYLFAPDRIRPNSVDNSYLEIDNIDDIYVISDNSKKFELEHSIFILFDDQDRIVSFIGLAKDNRIAMTAW